ncbi:MAG: D-tyrosyl-tRNA(Tyr) deacylase [Candidatus Gastranaerophilales bacterium]|nr:D-tyrosyl-tRNA(Tyr) deacylase [Candidatus Gastranaerophilales bacterium]
MKIVIQRVKNASVLIDNKIYSSINEGLLVLFGAQKGDKKEFCEVLADKILNLRIFSDENGKMNLSLKNIKGEILVVSQFTLASDCKKGLRPSFDNAEIPNIANGLYEYFTEKLRKSGLSVKTGIFGAHMEISLVNNGPVTFILEKNNGHS